MTIAEEILDDLRDVAGLKKHNPKTTAFIEAAKEQGFLQ